VLELALVVLARASVPVHWDAPQGCASEQEFARRVAAQAETAEQDAASLSVAVTVRQRPDGRWTLVLDLRSDEQIDHRELEGESCDAVVDAAALIVALRLAAQPEAIVPAPLEPEAGAEMAEAGAARTPAPPQPAPPVRASTQPIATRTEVARRREAEPVSGWIALASGPALGVLPGVGAAIGAEGGVQGRRFRAGASVRAYPLRTVPHPAVDGVSGRFDLVTAGVLGCGMPVVRRVAFPLCARVDAGGLRGVGLGAVTQPSPRWRAWAGAAVSAGVAWRIVRSVAPLLGVEGVVSLVRPAYSTGGVAQPLFQGGGAGFRAWLGIEVHFGPRKSGAPQT
jgi:hypothetical protein